jgi:hypothetical protein
MIDVILLMDSFRNVAFLWLILLSSARAELVTLYGGSGLPAAEPWLVFGADTISGWSQTAVAGGVRLTTDLPTRSGYSNYNPFPSPAYKNPAFPQLRRSDGFELTFRTSLLSESHSNANRAGYSVILLAQDVRGIELGFWQNEIWAQNPDFTHAEGVSIDTTIARDYRLQVIGEEYRLFEGTTSLLSGALRTYTSPTLPYTLPNYVYFGDNTTSASGSFLQGFIRLESNLSSVPEPSSMILASVFGIGCCAARRIRVKSKGPIGSKV